MSDDRRGLDRIRRQISGGLPEGLDEFLALPRQGMPYHDGTIVPMLGHRFRQRPSGLIVPASVNDPEPSDLVGTYITATEVFGGPLSGDELSSLLDGLSAKGIVRACAALLDAHEQDAAGLDLRLAGHVLEEDARERALNLLSGRERRFITPQLALLASAAALLIHPWEVPNGSSAQVSDVVASALLHLHMGDLAGRAEDPDETVLFGNVGSGLALEVVANQMFNSSTNLGSDIARHERLWHHLAAEVAQDRGLPDLRVVFEDATGIPLDVFEAVGFGLFAAREKAPLVPKSWFRDTEIAPDHLDAVLSRTAYSPPELAARLADDLDADFSANRWRLDGFSERPILDFDDESWLIHSPQLLVDRFFSGLAFWDAYFHASGADQPQVRNAWSFITEQYGQEVLESIAPAAAGQRVWREAEIQAAYGTQRQRNADAVIEYSDAWVVIDFSSRMASRALAQARNVEALEEEIEILIGHKAGQLDATIAALLQDESRLTGRPSIEGRRFHPVVVVHSKWPVNPVTYELARLKAQDERHLQGPTVAPLTILTIEELEIVEAVQERGGPDFASLLQRHSQGSLHRTGMKDHVLLVEQLDVGRPRRMEGLLQSSSRRVIDAFGFAEEDYPPGPAGEGP